MTPVRPGCSTGPIRQWPRCPGELLAGPDAETPRGRPVGRIVTGLLQRHPHLSKGTHVWHDHLRHRRHLVDSNYRHALAWYRPPRRYHAGKLGVPTFAVRTGGFSDTELCGARAIAVYDSLSGLQADLGRIIARN